MTGNKTFVYKKIPTGAPVAGEHIAVEDRPIDITAPPAGGVILKLQYASLDPYLRGRMRDPSIKSYAPALEPEQGIANGTIGTVIKSDNADFPESTLVAAYVPIAQYARVENVSTIRKIENPHNLDISLFLGPLGMPGITAWSGYHKIGQPKKGETIFVSSAAGAVGQIVGQIAKREGLTVIGSVGSEEKLDFIKELGYDHGFIYKKEKPLDALKRLAPDGVDIYFDNVGGTHLEAALEVMKLGGRIVICGAVSDDHSSYFAASNSGDRLSSTIPQSMSGSAFAILCRRYGATS